MNAYVPMYGNETNFLFFSDSELCLLV